jgi:lipopolysaccharide export system protein LptC
LNSLRTLLRHRLTLLLATLAVFALAMVGPRQPEAEAVCNAASVDYYSDATYTTVVGNCTHGCCRNWVCTGQLTEYSVVVYKETCN